MTLQEWADSRDILIDDALVSLQVLLKEFEETMQDAFVGAPTDGVQQDHAVRRVEDAVQAAVLELANAEKSLMTARFRLTKVL